MMGSDADLPAGAVHLLSYHSVSVIHGLNLGFHIISYSLDIVIVYINIILRRDHMRHLFVLLIISLCNESSV